MTSFRLFFVMIFCIGLPGSILAGQQTLALPITLDYPLMKSLVIKKAYPDENRTAIIFDDGRQCNRIVLTRPDFRQYAEGQILFDTHVSVQAGLYFLDHCTLPVAWQGYVSMVQEPYLDSDWVMRFKSIESKVFDNNRKPAKLVGLIWNLFKDKVYDYLENIHIDLTPPVNDLKGFIGPLFPADLQDRARQLKTSMQPGQIEVSPRHVKVNANVTINLPEASPSESDDEQITEAQINDFISQWETLDAFLVFMLSSLSKEPLTTAEQQVILDVLLETRYAFAAKLGQPREGPDFVRQQFISAWSQLAPMFRKHLGDDPSHSLLAYLGFFSASDALLTLDRLGPTLGIEVSRNGLIRLARLLRRNDPTRLEYGIGVDKVLRRLLGLPPEPQKPEATRDESNLYFYPHGDGWIKIRVPRLLARLFSLGPKPAYARTPWERQKQEILKYWLVSKTDIKPYINRVRGVVGQAIDASLQTSFLQQDLHPLFANVIEATAWQESCLRQFVNKIDRVGVLRSYNGTSVGVMQINERVWRGIYDLLQLRWDIYYNAKAGCEIVDLYFNRYALRKIKEMGLQNTVDNETLARSIYAMYNGGPSQFRKFIKRHARKRYHLSDKLFLQKLHWVEEDQWGHLRKCLIGS